MPCVPALMVHQSGAKPTDAFAFAQADGLAERSLQNLTALWSVPWVAYWALAFEALNPGNYRL